MEIRYYIDPQTEQPHIYNHGIEEYEVERVLRYPHEIHKGRDDSRHAIGQAPNGRFLRVIYVPDSVGDGVFVITAYDLRGRQLVAYRRRARRSNR